MKAAVFAIEHVLVRPRPWWPPRWPGAPARPTLRRHARALVAAHRRCGHATVLFTSAPVRWAEEVRRQCGADLVLAAPPHCDDEWLRPGQLRGFLADWRLCPNGSYGYASRYADRRWLQIFTHAVAANPEGRLRRLALVSRWRLVDLDARTPVPAHGEPVSLPPPASVLWRAT